MSDGSGPASGGASTTRLVSALAAIAGACFGAFYLLYRQAPGATAGDRAVVIWWSALSAVSIANLLAWTLSARALVRDPPDARRRWQLVLCGLFVAGCALRSFFPKADVQRICLYDSFWSSVLVGRSIATLAELSFVGQWALVLGGFARDTGSRVALGASRLVVPLIFFAEVWSWYAVLSTSYLGNVVEESTWTATVCFVAIAVADVLRRAAPRHRRFLVTMRAMCVAYVPFMVTVDVRMYVERFLAQRASGHISLPIGDGLHDLATRWIVTFRWQEWRREIAWMSLYFSVMVWLSLALLHAPRLATARESAPSRP